MMKKKWMILVGSGLVLVGIAFAGSVFAKSDETEVTNGSIALGNKGEADFPDLASLTITQALEKALDAVPGKILKIELEDENDFLVYGVEVVTADKSIMDVKVDAGSGKILAMEQDRADEEDHN